MPTTIRLASVVLLAVALACASAAKRDFDKAAASDTASAYSRFLEQHPSGSYADSAKARIAAVEKEQQQRQEAEAARVRLAQENASNVLLRELQVRDGDITKALASCKAVKCDLNRGDSEGRTPLILAVGNGNESAVRLLVEAGADVNKAVGDGLVPLHFAADSSGAIAQALIAAGARVDERSSDKLGSETPLHTAAQAGSREVARELIAAGAAINARTARGHTPLDFARSNCHDEVAGMLTGRGGISTISDKEIAQQRRSCGDRDPAPRCIMKCVSKTGCRDTRVRGVGTLREADGWKKVCE